MPRVVPASQRDFPQCHTRRSVVSMQSRPYFQPPVARDSPTAPPVRRRLQFSLSEAGWALADELQRAQLQCTDQHPAAAAAAAAATASSPATASPAAAAAAMMMASTPPAAPPPPPGGLASAMLRSALQARRRRAAMSAAFAGVGHPARCGAEEARATPRPLVQFCPVS